MSFPERPVVEFVKFEPKEQHGMIPGVIRCYQTVFAEHPWQEWLFCKKCKNSYGSEAAGWLLERDFLCCDEPLTEFWPASKVGLDLKNELHKERNPEASCWLATHNGIVVGFCWGYPVTVEKLELKLGLPGIAARLKSEYGVSQVAYQDELGVLSPYRGQGIAKQLFHHRLQDFHQKNLTVGVVRTKETPPSVTYQWFTKKLGYATVEKYHPLDGRVVLARNISTISSEAA